MNFCSRAVSRSTLLLLLLFAGELFAQTASLKEGTTGLAALFKAVSEGHPQIKAAKFGFEAAKHDVEAVNRRRWPTISVTMESDTGSVNSTPTQVLQVEHVFIDAGRLSAQIAEANVGEVASKVAIDVERRRLFIELIGAWQGYVSAQLRFKVGEEVLARLRGYREMMQRRVDAEVSPSIDLAVLDSRMIQAQVEQAQVRSAMGSSMSRLKRLTGLSEADLSRYLHEVLAGVGAVESTRACVLVDCWRSKIDSHPLVVRASLDVESVQHRLKAKEAERWPTAYVRLAQPLDMGSGQAREVTMRGSAFVGMRYVPGAGFENFAQASALASRLALAQESVDTHKRELIDAQEVDSNELLSSIERLQSHQKLVGVASKVLDSFTAQFAAGRKTWLDLLNSVRDLSQHQFAQNEAQVSMIAAMYRLEIRAGDLEFLQ